VVSPKTEELERFLVSDPLSFRALLYASDVTVDPGYQAAGPTGVAVSGLGTAYIPLAGVIDVAAEVERLRKQEDEALTFLEKSQRKLANEKFITKAPAEVVERERDLVKELGDKLARLKEQLAALQ